MAKKTGSIEQQLSALRVQVREVIIAEGAPLAVGAGMSETLSHLICDVAQRIDPKVLDEIEALCDRVPPTLTVAGVQLRVELSNAKGPLMNAWGDAGYFVGVAVGLELAALTRGAG